MGGEREGGRSGRGPPACRSPRPGRCGRGRRPCPPGRRGGGRRVGRVVRGKSGWYQASMRRRAPLWAKFHLFSSKKIKNNRCGRATKTHQKRHFSENVCTPFKRLGGPQTCQERHLFGKPVHHLAMRGRDTNGLKNAPTTTCPLAEISSHTLRGPMSSYNLQRRVI